MIRHLLLLTLRDDVTQEDLEGISAGFDALAREIPEIAGLQHGAALQLPGSSAQPADYAVALDFENEEAFARYIDHPIHREFVRTRLLPVRTGGMSAQIRIQDGRS
ncbi:MAG: Dabb family protein [Thermaerobacter sp.]|nr:Dabb family protein [Thermaerobacter sp.]